MHYEGLINRDEHASRIRELSLWIELAHELQTDMIAIPSSFLSPDDISDDINLIVSDLREAADLCAAASPPIRVVYESLCWGTRVDTWESCWDVVERVDRANFGIVLDSFNIAGRIYADPSHPSGKTLDAEIAVQESMERLVARVDPKRVFYIQIVDAERLQEPLVEGHPLYNAEQPCRMTWSRNCRLFYRETEHGAYLPVKEIATAIFNGLGFEGWVSLELFNRKMADTDPSTPEELARRGAASWDNLVADVKLRVDEPRISSS
jgi:4-hydroxyphenylpyruvate dioxygenase